MNSSVAIVTGGASGIGLGIVHRLMRDGHSVAIIDKDEAALGAACDLVSETGGSFVPITCDITDIKAFPDIIENVSRQLGTPTILVNNAAKGGGGTLSDVSEEMYDGVFAASVKGSFFLAQAVLPGMKAAGHGRIVNISSLVAAKGDAANSHYVSAKAALIGMTRAWALELAPFGITCNAVLPALTDTNMTRSAFGEDLLAAKVANIPMGRLATPDNCAALVAFFVAHEAEFVTGQILSANGGEFVGSM